MFFVEWEIDAQVTPLDRPLPPGDGVRAAGDIREFDFFTASEDESSGDAWRLVRMTQPLTPTLSRRETRRERAIEQRDLHVHLPR